MFNSQLQDLHLEFVDRPRSSQPYQRLIEQIQRVVGKVVCSDVDSGALDYVPLIWRVALES